MEWREARPKKKEIKYLTSTFFFSWLVGLFCKSVREENEIPQLSRRAKMADDIALCTSTDIVTDTSFSAGGGKREDF